MPVLTKPPQPTPDVVFAKAVDAMVKFIWVDFPKIEQERIAKQKRHESYKQEMKKRGLV